MGTGEAVASHAAVAAAALSAAGESRKESDWSAAKAEHLAVVASLVAGSDFRLEVAVTRNRYQPRRCRCRYHCQLRLWQTRRG